MSKSKTVHDPPPPMYSKLKVTPSPFSKERCGKCCLSAKQWRKLRDWIDEHYGHPDLPEKLRESMTVKQMLFFCNDTLSTQAGSFLVNHYAMEIWTLPFRRQLDGDAIEEAVKNLGWTIDSKGLIQRGASGGK